MRTEKFTTTKSPRGLYAVGLIAAILVVLFWRSFLPELVHFNNDGPLGQQNVDWLKLPSGFSGMWADLNDTGFSVGAFAPSITGALIWLLGPVGMAKFFAPLALFILGLGAWIFFRTLKLSPLAAALGAVAAMLNSAFFSSACWGVASQQIALGVNFLALALVVANTAETPWLTRWLRFALAGLCVGINIMEASDIGALYSMLIAGFIFYKAVTETGGSAIGKTIHGVGSVAVVALFAAFLAAQTVVSLIGTQIQGVAGTGQDTETKAQHWDWATQWSLPKAETAGILVPGLFGYKMDTPKGMMPAMQDAYRGGLYWGGMGRDPAIDRYFDSGGTEAVPQGFMRFTGGGNYCGILVFILAMWTIAQSLRRQNSPLAPLHKKIIWFWAAVIFVSLLFAWGRFAPFYALLYKLPYFSTIRNPAKFLIFFSWGLVILFAFGVHLLSRRHLDAAAAKTSDLTTQLKNWWSRVGAFDRKWTLACGGAFGASVLGWLIYSAQKPSLVRLLQKTGFPDADYAGQLISFSIGQAGWFLVLFAVALALFTLIIAGYFAGPRARTGAILLGAFLIFDLVRANLPYIIHWDYKQKYEIGSLNPIVDFLRTKPYEYRVAGLPLRAPQGLELLDEVYRIEWMQHHFPYYDIQCLDLIQMSRMPENLKAYLETFAPRGDLESAHRMVRRWQLTNTRYLLGAAGYLDVLNQQLDASQQRFRIAKRFEILPKPGVTQATQLEELTAVENPNGPYALFEFTGALPRVKLYSNWQVNTNDSVVLNTLALTNFDPAQTVLVSTPEKDLPAVATNENSGSVEFKSYAPKHLVFAAQATVPSVMLLNDKYDPNWSVSVDGKPAELLRCNFMMRGVYLPAGSHTVELKFSLPSKPLYVTLTAIVVGILLSGLLVILTRKPQTSSAQ